MSNGETAIKFDSLVWRGVEGYAHSRISELTKICTNLGAGEPEIRAAQAGIQELERLLALPVKTSATAQAVASQHRKKGY